MKGLTFRIVPENARIYIGNDTGVKGEGFKVKTYPHYKAWSRLVDFLNSIGFSVGADETVAATLKPSHIRGRKGDLELKGEIYMTGANIEFFQNIVFSNRHGGEYDFDKYQKMPYLIRLQFINTCNKICEFLIGEGLEFKPTFKPATAVDFIKHSYVESWHHPEKDMGFDLSSLDGTTCKESYNAKDRDEKILCNGEIKYFRDHNGYLAKGKIYHNINNMWWVILNDYKVTNIASFEFFDLSESEPRRRVKKGKVPADRQYRIDTIKSMSDAELVAELRRRKILIAG